MSSSRILAIDPSLTCTGWAFFDVNSEKLLGVGKIKSKSPKFTLSERLLDLQNKVRSLYIEIKICSSDFVVCETPTSIVDPSAVFKLEQVRGIYEVLAREFKAEVPGRINPRSVQRDLLGLKGKQLNRETVKSLAENTVKHLYGKVLDELGIGKEIHKNQDIVDAILIGALALTKIKSAKRSNSNVAEIFVESKKKVSSLTQ